MVALRWTETLSRQTISASYHRAICRMISSIGVLALDFIAYHAKGLFIFRHFKICFAGNKDFSFRRVIGTRNRSLFCWVNPSAAGGARNISGFLFESPQKKFISSLLFLPPSILKCTSPVSLKKCNSSAFNVNNYSDEPSMNARRRISKNFKRKYGPRSATRAATADIR